MDDLESPRGLALRARRHLKEGHDLADILASRGPEWTVAAELVAAANTQMGLLGDAVDLAVAASPPAAVGARQGGYILTYSGVKFWPMDPRPEEVVAEDIAHALAAKARFGGHAARFYSVAAHSLRVARMAKVIARKEMEDPKLAFALGLLHDAHEAYLADIPAPVKPSIPGWLEMEARVQNAVLERFGLFGTVPYAVQNIVDQADRFALALEVDALYPPNDEVWGGLERPVDPEVLEAGAVTPWGRAQAEGMFIAGLREHVSAFDMPEPEPEPEPIWKLIEDAANIAEVESRITPEERERLVSYARRLSGAAGHDAAADERAERPATTKASWLSEVVQSSAPDPRVERNRRRLMGDGW